MTKKEIEKSLETLVSFGDSNILEYCTIRNDGTVDVMGEFKIMNGLSISKLPVKFGTVSEDFYCGFGKLITLEGCPHTVGRSFVCSHNDLTSLVGGPKSVRLDYYCAKNQLTSLEGAPPKVRQFSANFNLLDDLDEHLPIAKNYALMENPLLWKWIVKHNYDIECVKFLLNSMGVRSIRQDKSKFKEQFLDLCPSTVRKGIEHKMRHITDSDLSPSHKVIDKSKPWHRPI